MTKATKGRYLISVAEASSEHFLRELAEYPGCELVERLDARRHVCDLEDGFQSLFWQHCFPVQAEIECSNLQLEELICLDLSRVDIENLDTVSYGVQVSANQRLEFVFQDFIQGLRLCYQWADETYDPRRAQRVLSIHFHVQDGKPKRAFVGASKTRNNLSSWTGGEFRWAKGPSSVSRAEGKIVQALEEFCPGNDFSGCRVLDLGAAPGGWSRVLAEQGSLVDAVDPADLDPSLLEVSTIRHFRETAGIYLRRSEEKYDLIVSDMKMDANLAAEILVRLANRLKSEGRILSTLKLPKGNRALGEVKEALKKISRAHDILEARQLYMNRSEITVLLQPHAD